MKRLFLLLIVLIVVLNLALAGKDDDRPGRRNRNRNRNQNQNRQKTGGRGQKTRPCKYERPLTKPRLQCTSPEPITISLNLNATARHAASCAATKEVNFNCSKVCKYSKPTGPRPACDAATNERTLTMTLKSGMPSWCAATQEKKKPCPARRRRPRDAEAMDASKW